MKLLSFFFLCSFSLGVKAETASDFLNLCKATLSAGASPKNAGLCESIHQKFFSTNKPANMVTVTPDMVGAPPSPIDGKIQFFMFNDPNYLAGVAYCYFVYRNWIRPKEIGPDTLGMSASGFSILNENLESYEKWLTTSTFGKECKGRVEKEAEVSVAHLAVSLKGQVALIGLNPFAAIQTPGATLESVMQEMKLTINHERIHAYQVACPDFEKWSMKAWSDLPAAKKNEYIKKYPSYNWSIPQIAGREYIGFLYESTPEKIGEQIKGCKI